MKAISRFLAVLPLAWLFACGTPEAPVATIQKKAVVKPPSSYEDSLIIDGAAAVFFEPDSAQYLRIREVTDPQVFAGSTHEYSYQMRNAHRFLNANWPRVPVIEAKNVRFLLFRKSGSPVCMDLNRQDPYGLFLFDGRQDPVLIDMTNIDTQVPDYFRHQ